jgi:AhpC/TSA family
VWQKLYEDLDNRNFVVLAIAMDVPEAARPWIDAAKPSYPCLIDSDHHVADLYNMINVPQAVWINEAGRMVRPPENAGAADTVRFRDPMTGVLPADKLADRAHTKAVYVEAVRDWVRKGTASEHVLDDATARTRMRLPNDDVAASHTRFRLGQRLMRAGETDEAARHFALASRLHPDSWNIWRQAAAKDATGLAATLEFWDRVARLGDRPYYLPVEIRGLSAHKE